ncbi:hypothetical protein CCUS01_15446 [Colletotrichum cuscutae]|uniref:Uncharacterized protein n=1 Tax=Colletotrichum cuscutae TaxID=1209917 RepID=A0AAI9VH93_9PEZI|nr:hypothetical protein CCUS01_15446 [Colletotrichum cuscutae]
MGGPGDVASGAVLQYYFANSFCDFKTGQVMPSFCYESIDVQVLYGYSIRRLIFRHGNLFYVRIIYDNYIAHTFQFITAPIPLSSLSGYVPSASYKSLGNQGTRGERFDRFFMNLSTPDDLYGCLKRQPGACAEIGKVIWCDGGFWTYDNSKGRPGIILGYDSHTRIYIISPTSTKSQGRTDTHLFLAGSPNTQDRADLHFVDGSNNRIYMPKDCYFNYRDTWAVPHDCVRPMDKGTIRVDKNSRIFDNQNKFAEA